MAIVPKSCLSITYSHLASSSCCCLNKDTRNKYVICIKHRLASEEEVPERGLSSIAMALCLYLEVIPTAVQGYRHV